MAGASPDAASSTVDGFGRVSRTVGTVFRYLLLAATLVGVVALAILLLFVTNDAIQPLTASPTWLLSTTVTMLLIPGGVAAWLAYRHPAEFRSGAGALGLLFVGILYAGGVVIVFSDVVPPVSLFAYAVALLVPAAAVVATERVDDRFPFFGRVFGTAVVGGLSLWAIPGAILALPTLPADWVILLLVLGTPAAAIAGLVVYRRFESRSLARNTAVASFLAIGALGLAGIAFGLHAPALVILGIVGLLPFGVYVGMALYDRGTAAVGVVLPVAAVGGIAAGLTIEATFGLAGPKAWLNWGFLTSVVSAPPTEAGIYPGIAGTILLMINVALLSFPIGVGAAVYLEEYAGDTWFTRVIDVNISNLAGVPSVVYGLLGLGAFIRFGGLAPGTVIVGGMTLALLILPIVIISAREAIRAVPDSQRRAAYGMGATRWETVRTVVLPEAFPGILTGTILALGRAVGETAPLLVIGAPAIFGVPGKLGDRVGAVPLQIYTWASTFADEAFFTTVLAAGVVTMLVILLTMNSLAIVLRNKYERN